MKKIFFVLTFTTLNLVVMPLQASYLPFMKDSPVRFFTAGDWKIFDAAVEDSLNHSKNGVKKNWRNEASGSNGVITPLRTFEKNGHTCRDLKIFSIANHYSDELEFTFCKYDKQWKIPGEA